MRWLTTLLRLGAARAQAGVVLRRAVLVHGTYRDGMPHGGGAQRAFFGAIAAVIQFGEGMQRPLSRFGRGGSVAAQGLEILL